LREGFIASQAKGRPGSGLARAHVWLHGAGLALLVMAALGALALSGAAGAYSTSFVNVAASAGTQDPGGLGDPLNPLPPPPITPNVTWPQYVALMNMWGGVAVGDYNNDSYPDVFVTNGDAGPSVLYRNDGNLTFTEVGASAGVAVTGRSMGASWGDFDNDGCRDLFVASFTGPSSLFKNNCDGTFSNVTSAANISVNIRAAGVAWGDVDRDGFIDLAIGCYLVCENVLLHNNGDGTFSDVTAAAGVGDFGWTFQPVFFDYDRDGDLDLWDVNDFGQDRLYRNNDDGTFTDVTQVLGIDREGAGGMGAAVGDIDNDGRFDFFVTNYYNDSLYRNTGSGFVETFGGSPIHDYLVGWGADLFDAENDGDLDLYLANGFIFEQTHSRFQDDKFFENQGGGVFVNASGALDAPYGGVEHGVATADFDLDGDLDVFVVSLSGPSMLLRNDGQKGAWLKLDLEGTVSNRDAVGATVTVRAGGLSVSRMLLAGNSYLSQDDHTLHFGLGGATFADSVTIEWPSGALQVLTNVSLNQTLRVTEPPSLIARAGGDPVGRPGVALNLSAALSIDPLDGSFPSGANYTWTVDLGGTTVDLYGASVNYTFAASGAYRVTLRLEDSLGNIDLDALVVYIRDERPPNARAGADQTVCDSATARFDGSNTTDNDPTFAIFGNFSWQVELPSGPLTIYGRRVSLVVGVPGNYTVTMSARDPTGNVASDALVLTVPDCTPPAVALPSTLYIKEGELLTITPTTSDSSSDFALAARFDWSFEDGAAAVTSTNRTLAHRFNVPGVLFVRLRVSDGAGNSAQASTTVVVADVTPPSLVLPARFSADQAALLRLDASGVTDNDPTFPATGTFTWTVHLPSPGGGDAPLLLFGASPSFSFGTPGTFRADLSVTDRSGNVATGSTQVEVRDTQPPVVHAGVNREVTAGSTVAFEATASDNDPAFAGAGSNASFAWVFNYGGQRVELAGPQSSFRFEIPGVYIVTLTVRDAAGNEATDHVDLRVVTGAADPWPSTQRALAVAGLAAAVLIAVPFWRRAKSRGIEGDEPPEA
jgi:enediyne biosynthesis protein E4